MEKIETEEESSFCSVCHQEKRQLIKGEASDSYFKEEVVIICGCDEDEQLELF